VMCRRKERCHGGGEQPSPEHQLIGRDPIADVGQQQSAKDGSGTMAAKKHAKATRSGGKLITCDQR
jgi:hypothetical protein